MKNLQVETAVQNYWTIVAASIHDVEFVPALAVVSPALVTVSTSAVEVMIDVLELTCYLENRVVVACHCLRHQLKALKKIYIVIGLGLWCLKPLKSKQMTNEITIQVININGHLYSSIPNVENESLVTKHITIIVRVIYFRYSEFKSHYILFVLLKHLFFIVLCSMLFSSLNDC